MTRRWPFVLSSVILLAINLLRLGSDVKLRIWNDPVCAIYFVGYLLCCAIAVSIKTPAPSGDISSPRSSTDELD